MNHIRTWLLLSLSALLSVACGGASSKMAPNPSPHFDEVSSHLQLGGEMYVYVDVDGDIQKLTDKVSDVVERVDPNGDVDREKIAQVLRATGVGNLQALGLSSYEDGALFRNRAYLKFAGQREGIMKAAGGEPHAFEALDLAPSGSDLVIEQDLHLKQGYDVVMGTLKAFEPEFVSEIESELKQPIPGLALTAADIVRASDTKIVLIAKLDAERRIDMRDMSPNLLLPHVDFAIALDGYGFVVDQAADQYGQSGLFDVSRGKDLLILQLSVPAPPTLQGYKPVLARQGGRLWLASTRAFLDATLGEGEKISGDSSWTTASEGLASRGNGMSYISSEFFGVLRKVASQVPTGEEERALTEAIVGYFLPEGDDALASVQVNGGDSLYYASNSTFSHKATLGALLYINPVTLGVLGAVALPSFLSYQRAAAYVEEVPVMPKSPPNTTPPTLAPPAKPAVPNAGSKKGRK